MTMQQEFSDIKNAVTSALVETTKTAGHISTEDLAFHRSSNPSIVPLLDKQNARLLKVARSLTRVATLGTEFAAPQVKDVDSMDDGWRSMVDIFDNLLEKADASLDEFTGSIRRLSPSQEEQMKRALPAHGKQQSSKGYRNRNIPKPQLLFASIPKNEEKPPFKPLLRSKPHATVPLESSLILDGSGDHGSEQYTHPYETEIRNSRYPSATYTKSEPIAYQPYHETKATLVDTPEAVADMLEELKKAKEIAIDLEHHDIHSYIGLVSLMQISTRKKDWVVDTLKPWRQDLQVLNEVFADPNILKVFHGAFMDMIWLQRDLGLYVVGLFDTFHASRALGYPRNSLAYLLKHFADFDAAKQYQMADWRIRPLPDAMFDYARSDTHFLLYIYDNMRNELIDKSSLSRSSENLIETVLNNSKEEALQRYEHPVYDYEKGSGSKGWYNMLYRTPALFDREQFSVFRAMHQWRDQVARLEDESVHSVMPKQVLYTIARDTPLDMPSLLGCSHPMSAPFQERKDDLLRVIKQAKGNGATGPEMKELMQEIDPLQWQMIRSQGNHGRQPIEAANTAELPHATLPLRCEKSRFWGSSLSNATSPGPMVNGKGLSLALPLPQITAEIFEEGNAASKQPSMEHVKADQGSSMTLSNVANPPKNRNETFIIKQEANSRKRRATTGPANTERSTSSRNEDNEAGDGAEPEIALDPDSDIERRQEKAARKEEKKRLKRQQKQEEKEKANGSSNNGDVEAPVAVFDYATAPSVLHATTQQRSANSATAGGASSSAAAAAAAASKGFNPYAKSLDAPKGMQKSKKEIAARSHTFKN